MGHLQQADCLIHCKTEGPELCGREVVKYISAQYGNPKIGLIGYQPAMLDNLAKEFRVRVVDLNPDNIGQVRYGVEVEDGETNWKDVFKLV
jgi:hypothetical protein